jgi:Protein of unknown function (DUF3768)
MTQRTHETASRIAALNDLLRKGGFGGTVCFTSGVRERGQVFVIDALRAIREFTDFTPDNDPYGEHDFGAVLVPEKSAAPVRATFAGRLRKVFRKIDYYAPGLTVGSEDPSDPGKTARVLTIMLAEEY